MPTPGETSVVEHEIRIAARPETVFAFFTDPARMVRWMGTEATLDPRPGGACRINVNDASVMLGEFVEVDPHRRIVFTWGWEGNLFEVPPQSTAVEVSFTPDGDGTIVRLAHRRLPTTAISVHQAGWGHYLGRLALAAAGRDPGPDPFLDLAAAARTLGAVAADAD
jgi:uncharacterized protein YndB with AHSA1/START domain